MSEAEARAFVSSLFDHTSSVEGAGGVGRAEVYMADTHCDAGILPVQFDAKAMVYEIDRTGSPYWMKHSTIGAVYQGGYLYLRSNAA